MLPRREGVELSQKLTISNSIIFICIILNYNMSTHHFGSSFESCQRPDSFQVASQNLFLYYISCTLSRHTDKIVDHAPSQLLFGDIAGVQRLMTTTITSSGTDVYKSKMTECLSFFCMTTYILREKKGQQLQHTKKVVCSGTFYRSSPVEQLVGSLQYCPFYGSRAWPKTQSQNCDLKGNFLR